MPARRWRWPRFISTQPSSPFAAGGAKDAGLAPARTCPDAGYGHAWAGWGARHSWRLRHGEAEAGAAKRRSAWAHTLSALRGTPHGFHGYHRRFSDCAAATESGGGRGSKGRRYGGKPTTQQLIRAKPSCQAAQIFYIIEESPRLSVRFARGPAVVSCESLLSIH
jgi:hypothetical protein